MKPMPSKIKNIVEATLKSEFFRLVPENNKEKVHELCNQIMHSIIMDNTSQFLTKLDKICDPIHNKILNMLSNSLLPDHIQEQIKTMKQEKNLFNKIALKISSLKERLDDTVKFKLQDMKEDQSLILLERLECKACALTVCLNTIKKMNNTIVIEKLAQNDYSVNLVLVISEIEKKIKNTTELTHVLSESLSYVKMNHMVLEDNQLTESINSTILTGKSVVLETKPHVSNLSNVYPELISESSPQENSSIDKIENPNLDLTNVPHVDINKILKIREEQGSILCSPRKRKM